jgi:hypothetical protein
MIITFLLFLLLASVVLAALIAFAVIGIVNLADERRKRLTTLSLSAANDR